MLFARRTRLCVAAAMRAPISRVHASPQFIDKLHGYERSELTTAICSLTTRRRRSGETKDITALELTQHELQQRSQLHRTSHSVQVSTLLQYSLDLQRV